MQFLVLTLVPLAALVILIILVARTTGHAARIESLEKQIGKFQALERKIGELTAYIEALKAEIETLRRPATRRKEPPSPTTSLRIPEAQTAAGTSTLPTSAPSPQAKEVSVRQTAPSRTREEWEALIGGKLFNRIGARALIIGIGYFLKYAFYNTWIIETTRVLIGAVIGIACLGGGYRTHGKGFQVFAQGLVGAGIAILYLSVYAAFNFYGLVPQWVALVFMSIVTLVAFLNGLFYNSLAEALMGWAGGFLTPILLSTGQSNEIGLFSYIILLDVGLLAMMVKKERWWLLEPLTFAGTWLMYIAWREQYYTTADLWLTVFFVTLFWLLFLVAEVLRSRRAEAGSVPNQVLPGFNAFIYFLAMYALINEDHHAWMGVITLIIGATYFAVYVVKERRSTLAENLRIRWILTVVTMAMFATAIQFYDFDTVMAWSIEAVILFWLGKRYALRFLDVAGAFLFGLAVFKLLMLTDGALSYRPLAQFSLLLNYRALTFAVTCTALGSAAFLQVRSSGKWQETMSNILHSAWCGLLFLLVTVETNDFFHLHSLSRPQPLAEEMSFFRIMTFGVVWICVSLPVLWIGTNWKLIPPAVAGLVMALLAVAFGVARGIAFTPIEAFAPIVNVRSISLLLIATGLLLQTQLIQRSTYGFETFGEALKYLRVGMVLVLLILLTGETIDYYQKAIAFTVGQMGNASEEVFRLRNLQQLMLSGVWMLYSVVLMSVGIWRKYRGMRFAAIALFGITILKIFVYDLSFLQTLYRIFSIIALALILLGVSWAYQRYKHVILGKTE